MQQTDIRPTCRGCGGEITLAQTKDGTPVPLEKWTDSTGDRRYRIIELGPPLVVEPVSANSPIDAYPDHRKDCPRHGNSLG